MPEPGELQFVAAAPFVVFEPAAAPRQEPVAGMLFVADLPVPVRQQPAWELPSLASQAVKIPEV